MKICPLCDQEAEHLVPTTAELDICTTCLDTLYRDCINYPAIWSCFVNKLLLRLFKRISELEEK